MTDADERDSDRRARMFREYGVPDRFRDTAGALRIIGCRDDVHPLEAIAFEYRDLHAAEAYRDANLEHHGHPTLGIRPLKTGGVVGVLDLRAAIREIDGDKYAPIDPALPDDWTPPRGEQ